ncbi:hypothetical protein FIV42_20380 [Persicimonas caeni]|uniref:Tetratricopeptide repeat protein n=1 Tax=Persicimonas caeni TaxID=2292766 RepID=A0A4Y6PXF2_PERCE|nr:FxLYD domain-containing protein [Persicimonas caeni]QDG53014.1 hypothetical protein FIV42_20380 [Persicimonas caeni]QED34236.1 hypothetical protein FRD00_20375 [Persicimonas caeni]
MKTRKLFAALVVLFVTSLVWTTGCQSDQDKAKATIEGYVVADMLGGKGAVKQYLVKADREVIDKQLEEKKDSKIDTDKLAELAQNKLGDQFKVEIAEAKVDGDTMNVSAKITQPNEKELQKAVIGKMFEVAKEKKDASKEEQNKAIQDAVASVLEEEEFGTETVDQKFELRKEGDKWLVFVDLKTQEEVKEIVDAGRDLSIKGKIKEAKAKLEEAKKKLGERNLEEAQEDVKNLEVSILYDEARKLEREDEFEKAIANYKKIVEINPDWKFPPIKAEKAKEKISELEAKAEKKKAQDAYREKIALNGVEVKNLYGSKRIVGELKNDGDQVIDRVELAIKFFDKDGKEIHSDSSTPVFAYGKEAKAFKPGHSKKFTKYATNAPDAWDDKIEVTVSKVEFFEKK